MPGIDSSNVSVFSHAKGCTYLHGLSCSIAFARVWSRAPHAGPSDSTCSGRAECPNCNTCRLTDNGNWNVPAWKIIVVSVGSKQERESCKGLQKGFASGSLYPSF